MLSHAFRSIRRNPAFSVPAIGILAMGIGANVAIFAVAHAVLLRPLPFADQSALVLMWEQNQRQGQATWEVSYRDFVDWRAQNRSFSGLAATGSSNWALPLLQPEGPVALPLAAVSGSFFDVLGATPALGRTFAAADDERRSAPVAVISDLTWRTRFGADPDIVGRVARMGSRARSRPFTIIGVMPAEFDFPRGAAAWMPLTPSLADASDAVDILEDRGIGVLYVLGRLRPGVSLAAAKAEMDGIVHRLTATSGLGGRTAVLTPLTDFIFGQARPALILLLAAASLVLALTCANVVGLFLARLSANRRRVAVQMALGAGRSHLLRESVAEAGALTGCGLAAAAAVAYWAVPVLVALAPEDVPRISDVTLASPVLAAFTIGIAAVTAVICGCAPVVPLLRWRDRNLLRPGAMAPSSTLAARKTLLALQTALAVVLLAASVLALRSFDRVQRLDFGFAPSNLITFNVHPPDDRYAKTDVNARFYRQAIDRVRTLPGVAGVAALSLRPFELGPIGSGVALLVEGQSPDDRHAFRKNAALNSEAVTPDYFRLMQIPILRGRAFTERDTADAPAVVIVSDSAARGLWPGEEPVGKRVLTNFDGPAWKTVVGVAGDVRYLSLAEPARTLYKPYLQSQESVQHFIVKPAGAAPAFLDRLRPEIRRVDPHASVEEIRPLDDVVDRQTAPWRFSALLFALLAALAVAVAVTGLYALLAYQVAERTREIGIRMALGARRAQIVSFMAGRAIPAVFTGLMAGVAAALAGGRTLDSLVFGVDRDRPLTYVLVCLVLLATASVGAYLPVRRAASVDPLTALKEE